MSIKSKVAVIGLGNIGGAVATNLVKGNRSVIVANRTFAKALCDRSSSCFSDQLSRRADKHHSFPETIIFELPA